MIWKMILLLIFVGTVHPIALFREFFQNCNTNSDTRQRELEIECEKVIQIYNNKDWAKLSSHMSRDSKRLFLLARIFDGMDTQENIEAKVQLYKEHQIDEDSYFNFMEAVQGTMERERDEAGFNTIPGDRLLRLMSIEECVFTNRMLDYPEIEKHIMVDLLYANRNVEMFCRRNVSRVELHDDYAICYVELAGNRNVVSFGQGAQLQLIFVRENNRWLLSYRELHQEENVLSPKYLDFRQMSNK